MTSGHDYATIYDGYDLRTSCMLISRNVIANSLPVHYCDSRVVTIWRFPWRCPNIQSQRPTDASSQRLPVHGSGSSVLRWREFWGRGPKDRRLPSVRSSESSPPLRTPCVAGGIVSPTRADCRPTWTHGLGAHLPRMIDIDLWHRERRRHQQAGSIAPPRTAYLHRQHQQRNK